MDLAPSQHARLKRFSATQSVDIHCHCLPGLDDGPATTSESLSLCRALVDDGITSVIATPHQLGCYDGRNEAAEIRSAVSDLTTHLDGAGIPLEVYPGGDVRVDERIMAMLDDDRVITLGDGGTFLLLELPHETFIDLRMLLVELRARGFTGIVTHPERHHVLSRRPQLLRAWLAEGALVQITAGSLVGDFGPQVEYAAWDILSSSQGGAATIIASDVHNTDGRRPRMSAAIDAIADRLGHTVARRVGIDNPQRVIPKPPRAGNVAAEDAEVRRGEKKRTEI